MSGTISEPSTTSNDSLKRTLLTVSNAFTSAWEKQDTKAWQLPFASDFIYVGPEGIQSKMDVTEGLTHCTLTSYSFDDVQLHQPSPTTATLIYKLHQQSSCEVHPAPSEMLATDSFVRTSNGWLLRLNYACTSANPALGFS